MCYFAALQGPCYSKLKNGPLELQVNSWTFTGSFKTNQSDYEDAGPRDCACPHRCKTWLSWGPVGLWAERMRRLTRPWLWRSQATEATSNSLTSRRTRPSRVPPACHCTRAVPRRWRTWVKHSCSALEFRGLSFLVLTGKSRFVCWTLRSDMAASNFLDHTHAYMHRCMCSTLITFADLELNSALSSSLCLSSPLLLVGASDCYV